MKESYRGIRKMCRSSKGGKVLMNSAVDNRLELVGAEGQRVGGAIIDRIFGSDGGEEGVSEPPRNERMTVIRMRWLRRGRR